MMNIIKNIKLYNIIIVILILLSSCKSSTQVIPEIEEIDLYGAYQNRSEVPVSSVASDIEYIRLETGKDFMTNDPFLINAKDSLIMFVGFRKMYIFSRNSGKFLYEISDFGRGPGEYTYTTRFYDENRDLVFAGIGKLNKDSNSYKIFAGYDFTGKEALRVYQPILFNKQNNLLSIQSFWPLSDTIFIGYSDDVNVNRPEKLIVYSSKGEFIKFHQVYEGFMKTETGVFRLNGHIGNFFNAADTIRFFELHTDTVFNVSPGSKEPRYHIHMGDLLLPYELYASGKREEYQNYFHIKTMHESSRFLMFSASIYNTRHIVFYDKTKRQTVVCNIVKDAEFYKKEHSISRCIGFLNDLDQFIPIGTDRNFYINKDDEFVTAIPALEVRRWFDMNPEKATMLPERLKAFNDIEAEDNPIIIVAKLKK